MRQLLIGVLIGLTLGWLMFDSSSDAPDPLEDGEDARTSSALRAPELASSGSRAPTHGVGEPPAVPDEPVRRPAGPDRSRILRGGHRSEINAVLSSGPSLSDTEVEALTQRLQEAQQRHNLALFLLCFRALGASGHTQAHTVLVELAADPDADLPEDIGKLFEELLKTSQVPGIVAAARMRIETSKRHSARKPWARLLLQHGTPEDIDWLLEEAQYRVNPTLAYTHLVALPLDRAQGYLARALREGPPRVHTGQVLATYATHHPEQGKALLERIILELAGGKETVDGLNGWTALMAYTQSISTEGWPHAAQFLSALQSEPLRLHAAASLAHPARLGYDLGPVEELLGQPAATLRRVVDAAAPGPQAERLLRLAAGAIETNPALHTEVNAVALEYAAARWPSTPHNRLDGAARLLRVEFARTAWR